jgi:hypothetical protein
LHLIRDDAREARSFSGTSYLSPTTCTRITSILGIRITVMRRASFLFYKARPNAAVFLLTHPPLDPWSVLDPSFSVWEVEVSILAAVLGCRSPHLQRS